MLGWVCRRYCCDGELLVFAVISGLWVGWVGFCVFRLGDLVGFLVWLMWGGFAATCGLWFGFVVGGFGWSGLLAVDCGCVCVNCGWWETFAVRFVCFDLVF